MLLGEELAVKLPAARVLFSRVVDASLIGIKADVVHFRHEIANPAWAAPKVKYTLAGADLRKAIEA